MTSTVADPSEPPRADQARAGTTGGCAYCGLPLPAAPQTPSVRSSSSSADTGANSAGANSAGANSASADSASADSPSANSASADRPSASGVSGQGPAPPRYCCFGCRLADQVFRGEGGESDLSRLLTRLGVAIFFSMNVMVFTLVLWSQDVYHDSASSQQGAVLHQLFRYLCLLFSLPVLLLLGVPLVENTWEDLRRKYLSTDAMLVAGVAAAFGYSTVSVFRGHGHVYFEVGCMVLIAVTLGRWLEATGKHETTSALRSLQRFLPERVRMYDGPAATAERFRESAEVQAGDTIRVLAGERIAVDGILIANSGAIDEQAVTGESVPKLRQPGDPVLAGTLNLDGDLVIRATSTLANGTLQQLIDTTLQAAMRKERYGRLADRVAQWFTPAMFVAATAALLLHWRAGDLGTALMIGLSVVLIACPCGLALATPLAIWNALAAASRRGIVVKNTDALTPLATARTICFDKTGTLTTGENRVVEAQYDRDCPSRVVLEAVRRVATCSNHVSAVAVARYAQTALENSPSSQPQSPAAFGDEAGEQPSESRLHPGRGIETRWRGRRYLLGSPRLMREQGLETTPPLAKASARWHSQHYSLVCIGWDGRVRGVFALAQEVRPEAAAALAALGDLGLETVMLTGDQAAHGQKLCEQLGIDGQFDLLPHEKLQWIEHFGKHNGPVVMVGDGINDAPALVRAGAGISLGSGTDVARQSADLCVLSSDLLQVPWAIDLARRIRRTIRWNLVWAFAYNLVGVGLAAAGLLNPIVAALAMTVSSFLVITNSSRLRTPMRDLADPVNDRDQLPGTTRSAAPHSSAADTSPDAKTQPAPSPRLRGATG